MAWFRKTADPITDRARVLNEDIARLESEIKRLDAQLQRNHSHPRLRSTALPHGAMLTRSSPESPAMAAPGSGGPADELIFEPVDQHRLKARSENGTTPEHYNELGVRKYDLPALFGRLRNQFR